MLYNVGESGDQRQGEGIVNWMGVSEVPLYVPMAVDVLGE